MRKLSKQVVDVVPMDIPCHGSLRYGLLARSLLGGVIGLVIMVVLLVGGSGIAKAQTGSGADIPPAYLQEYQQTGAAYELDWTILAAIGKVESDHGRYGSYGGCILGPPTLYGSAYGPMQFLESTWATMAIDGNGDGLHDSCNPVDSIPATANYLLQSGAPADYYTAIYAYNHSYVYVEQVLAQAREYYQVYY